MADDLEGFSVREMQERKRRMNGEVKPESDRPRVAVSPMPLQPVARSPMDVEHHYRSMEPPPPPYYDYPQAAMQENINVRHYWDVVKRRWLIVAFCIVAVTAISAAYSFVALEDRYQAFAEIRRRIQGPQVPGDLTWRYGFGSAHEDVRRIQTDQVFEMAAALMVGLPYGEDDADTIEVLERVRPGERDRVRLDPEKLTKDGREWMERLVQLVTEGDRGEASRMVDSLIHAEDETEEMRPWFVRIQADGARHMVLPKAANSVALAYRELNVLEGRRDALARAKFSRDLAEEKQQEIGDTQTEVMQLRRDIAAQEARGGGIADPNRQAMRLQQLQDDLAAARFEKIEIDSTIVDLQKSRSGAGGLLTDLGDLEDQLRQLKLKYRPQHPEVKRLQAIIDEKRSTLEAEQRKHEDMRSKDQYAGGYTPELIRKLAAQKGVDAKIRSLVARITELSGKMNSSELDPLAKRLSKLEARREGDLARWRDLLASAQIEEDKAKRMNGPIEVIDWAERSERQQPMRLQAAVLGLMAGGILGVLAAFFLEYVDDTVKTPTDIEKDLGMDCLGVIPMWESDRSVFMDPSVHNTPASEAFAQLRNSVRYSGTNGPEKLVLIASALQDEGKTAIAVNLAVSFNAEGNKVLLINTDLRRGGTGHIRRVLQAGEVDPAPGLSEFLSEQAGLEEIIRPTRVDGLYLVQAGEMLKNPAKLLHSERIREVFAYGEQEFDVVIVDSAAVLPVVDTTLFSGAVRGVLLVVGGEQTSVSHIKQAVKRLRHVGSPIVGAVLNRAREYSHGGYYHYYRYSYRGKVGPDSGGKRA